MSRPVACGKCGGGNLVAVEYGYDEPEHYDGVSEWVCMDCGYRVGRWSGRVLTGDDRERRYGREERE